MLLAILTASSAYAIDPYSVQHEPENGAAAVGATGDFTGSLSFGATLGLPPIESNRSWYCMWIMVAQKKGTFRHPGMIQGGGLIRWPQSGFRLQPFITVERPGKNLEFMPVQRDLDGEHAFVISGTRERITLSMDGAALYTTARNSLFPDICPLYVKIAAELYAEGDRVSGTAREVELTSGLSELHTRFPTYSIEDRGLRFDCGGGLFQAVGTFASELKTCFATPTFRARELATFRTSLWC